MKTFKQHLSEDNVATLKKIVSNNDERQEVNNNTKSIVANKTATTNHLAWIDDAFLVALIRKLGSAGKWKEAVNTFNQFTPELVSAPTIEAVSTASCAVNKKQSAMIDKKLQEMWSKKRM